MYSKKMVFLIVCAVLAFPQPSNSATGNTSVAVNVPAGMQFKDNTTGLNSNSISFTASIDSAFAVSGSGQVIWTLLTNNNAGAEVVATRTAFGGTGGSAFQNALRVAAATISSSGGVTPTYANGWNGSSKTLVSVPVGSSESVVSTDKPGQLTFSVAVSINQGSGELLGNGSVTTSLTFTATTL